MFCLSLVENRSPSEIQVMLQHFEIDTFRLCFDPTWQGQGSRANSLHALSVMVGEDLAAGGMVAQRACCEERNLSSLQWRFYTCLPCNAHKQYNIM